MDKKMKLFPARGPFVDHLSYLHSTVYPHLFRHSLANRTCNDATTLQDAIFANVFFVLKHVVNAILCALFTLDPGTQQPIIAHAVSRGHIVG
ncbi:hypothetical protein BLNAU_15182 [Blattamonas nauphoetae]|uniref:Uncharacterized protein n=1 Tax=Blattamonas nauphoetae TaxID=2049346 RepID=A0ABQ9XDV5_9EUKA|nr:hypothetical protein BLNAU_15182 [Blattamonas nauphoetae]